jgi:cytochrome c-type biogenesis protein CcmH
MLFWLFAIAVTAICCVALYYASVTGAVNAGAGEAADVHYRLQLAEINADIASGEMPVVEGEAAKGELAREFLRLTREAKTALPAGARRLSLLLPAALVVIAGIAFATYAMIGNPGIPSQPLAGRAMPAATDMDLDEAVKRIEAELKKNPDDLRGWTVVAPVYRGLGRYDDAINAYRRVLALSAPTADTETDLAETLLLKAGGGMVPEALQLLQSAAKRDPNHVRSRFYLAGYATEQKNYADAVAQWKALLALSTGGEAWVATAEQGLAAAEAGLAGKPLPQAQAPAPDPAQLKMIEGMVSGLDSRLSKEGGPLADWEQLVRSYIVLKRMDDAQRAYTAAKAAYPDAATRAELDTLAAGAGLE